MKPPYSYTFPAENMEFSDFNSYVKSLPEGYVSHYNVEATSEAPGETRNIILRRQQIIGKKNSIG